MSPPSWRVYGCHDGLELEAVSRERTAGVFEIGKTYTPVSFLPGLTRTGRPRPQASLRDDAVMIVLGFFTLVALFWDGILHNNTVGQDTFFSAPHMAMYAGLTGLGVWIALVLLRHQENRQVLDISLIPRGYGLAVFALPLAALSGPADFIWHSAYGFENQIDSTYSPPHQGLFISGAMLAANPACRSSPDAAAPSHTITNAMARQRCLPPCRWSKVESSASVIRVIGIRSFFAFCGAWTRSFPAKRACTSFWTTTARTAMSGCASG